MCLDHPEKVIKAAIIDIVPTLDMWAAMNKEAAIGGWHWPFMAQPSDFPERMLGSVPADWFMRKKLLKLTADLNHIRQRWWRKCDRPSARPYLGKFRRANCGSHLTRRWREMDSISRLTSFTRSPAILRLSIGFRGRK
jgi:hypothetical protein